MKIKLMKRYCNSHDCVNVEIVCMKIIKYVYLIKTCVSAVRKAFGTAELTA